MPANHKRIQRPQFQQGNQTRTEWAAGPGGGGGGGGGGGDGGEGVDSPADFPYNLQDRKPGDQSRKSELGKMCVVHVDKNCDMWSFATKKHLKLD